MNKAEVLAEHYQKTHELTLAMWEQRNRTFLILLGVVGAATLLTFEVSQAQPLLADLIANLLSIQAFHSDYAYADLSTNKYAHFGTTTDGDEQSAQRVFVDRGDMPSPGGIRHCARDACTIALAPTIREGVSRRCLSVPGRIGMEGVWFSLWQRPDHHQPPQPFRSSFGRLCGNSPS